MHRFFCPHLPTPPIPTDAGQGVELPDPLIVLDPEESHHAARVLRLAVGEKVGVLNGQGLRVEGSVSQVSKSQVAIQASTAWVDPPARPQVWIASAVAKGSRPDDMVDQLSQVNAAGWVPLIARRSVVDPRAGKVEKLRRVAIAAAKQSGRSHLMQVADPMAFTDALSLPADVRLLADASGEPCPGLSLARPLARAGKVIVYIGPEGGWTQEEIQQAVDAGCRLWRLAGAILRVETAAVLAAGVAGYLAMMPEAK